MSLIVWIGIRGWRTCIVLTFLLPGSNKWTKITRDIKGKELKLQKIFTTRNCEAPPGFLHGLSSNESKSTSITGNPFIFPAASKSIPLGCNLAWERRKTVTTLNAVPLILYFTVQINPVKKKSATVNSLLTLEHVGTNNQLLLKITLAFYKKISRLCSICRWRAEKPI